jgi:hypothetical protein
LEKWQEVATMHFAMDHFLLTLTAAVQNIKEALPYDNGHSILNAPRRRTIVMVPEIAPVYWAWHARNHVAHDYISLVMNKDAELAFGDGWACLNGAAVSVGPVATFQPVIDKDGEFVEPPQMTPKALADLAIGFGKAHINLSCSTVGLKGLNFLNYGIVIRPALPSLHDN